MYEKRKNIREKGDTLCGTMGSLKKDSNNGVSYFQMPLHYPRYTKKDYQDMPEWKLDRLLAEYGLSTHGDLAYKRDFAIGAFLWPDYHQDRKPSSSLSYRTFTDASLLDKKVK
ncbi:cytoplasmic tRNA 2-thiolation protein [Trema orientale]|uniref:Cytoplasmic tRNA 2-thiolation protein n=1 Tax=Trema orientale TaxID=63057 RepID=A0A2P5CX72_TREOI|nr:cytoplasmic tRNA 2-thiolation protein [Trema orientale]